MRSNIDKEIEAIDLDQLFDQYVETDLFQQYSDATTGPSSSEDLSYLFEERSSNRSDPCDTTALPNWGTTNEDAAWHKAVRRLQQQNAASLLIHNTSSSIYPHSGGKASLSDPILCGFEELFILDDPEPRLASQPSSPRLQATRLIRKARSSPDLSVRHGVHKTTVKKPASSSTIAKMMHPSTYRANFQDLWTRKLNTAAEAFNLHIPSNSLPPSTPPNKLSQHERSAGFFPREAQPYTVAMSPLPGEGVSSLSIQSNNYHLTPLSSPAIGINSQNSIANPFQFSNDGIGGAYITNTAALSALQTPPPSNRISMSTWGTDTPQSVDFSSFSSSPDFQTTTKTTGWWDTGSGSIPAQPSTPSPYRGPHSRSASQSLSFSTASNDVSGPGISCDSTSFGSFGPELDADLTHAASPFDMPPYSAVSRRKSSNGSQQSYHAHGRGASLGGDFVNFTPDDSRKILTGVAPSGSSKTKARREKEAAEKRRKLSQAAVKAVIEAGGDIGRLEKEGLLVLES
ncbi:hypothetical protein BU23DRAFT_535685 [Bimuria novae-zelandiae CBS 107.79]|uniref:Developmental regulatory protein wetA n=1 Tax=Bimuria novae-zelandiae CBS 107.79 TaxID=1447943 RepID=A0A6A5V3I8_9PLEO|nr:hypothetical protein BU23DRAFT_535685 [Bimuria novae-zelandiae CBS 107.79]